MKKVSLLLLMTLILMLAFSSCTLLFAPKQDGEGEHEHAFDDYLSYDSEIHYFSCECGEMDMVEDHYDEDGDGICDACEFEMYIPTTVYTVSVVASQGVTVSQTKIEAEEGTNVTFTAKLDPAYKLTVSGAKTVGEPVIENGYAVYTLKVTYILSDVTVSLGCELIVVPCEHDWTPATCDKAKFCNLCGETRGEALGHNYKAVVTDPTCTAAGFTTNTCSRCADSYVSDEVAALPHTEVADAAVAPTCTETGLTAGSHCLVCNEVLTAQTVIDALGHTEVADEAVAPTCTETGLTAGSHCSVCNEVLVAQTVVDALGHTEVADEAVAPTCTETGLTAGKHCSVCNEVLVAQTVVDALGHVEVVDSAVAATCTEAGLTEGKHCSVCNEVLVPQTVVNALGHTEVVDPAVAATCTEAGLTEGKHCSVCNEVLVAQTVVDALGHDHKANVTAPTCTDRGYTTYVCSCGDSYVADEVDELGHNYKAVVIAPTCTSVGYTTYTCSNCGDVYVADEIPEIGHNWKDATCTTPQICLNCRTIGEPKKGHDYTEATCTTPSTCNNCGNTKGSALGHSWVDATCDTPKTCSVCNITEGDVAPHDYIAVVKKPTCLEDGYTTYTCSKCSDSYVGDEISATGHQGGVADCEKPGVCTVCGTEYIDAIGHNYIATVVAPTCTEGGYTTHVCEHCSRTYVDSRVDALGHSGGVTTCTEGPVCTVCGVTYGDPLGHSYEKVVTPPTCTEEGFTTNACVTCGDSYKDSVVAAKGHTEVIDQAVAATCTESGLTEGKHCSACNEVLIAQTVVDALGHDYEVVVTPPTCTEEGYTTHTCHCGDSYVDNKVAATGHDHSTVVVTPPTCTEKGYTTHTCHCGDSYVTDEVEATGHDYDDVVTPPTCIAEGYTTHTCHCGDSYVDTYTSTVPHDNVYDSANKLWECSYCHAIEYELVIGENSFTVSTGDGMDNFNYAISNDIVVKFIAPEAGTYVISPAEGENLAKVNGNHLPNGSEITFVVEEDNLVISFNLGVRSRATNMQYTIDIVLSKNEVVDPDNPGEDPDEPIVGGDGVVEGEAVEGFAAIEITPETTGTYTITASSDAGVIALVAFMVGEDLVPIEGDVELVAGETYVVAVLFTEDTANGSVTVTYAIAGGSDVPDDSGSGSITVEGEAVEGFAAIEIIPETTGTYTITASSDAGVIALVAFMVGEDLVPIEGDVELVAGETYVVAVLFTEDTANGSVILTYAMAGASEESPLLENQFKITSDTNTYDFF